jgi:uncharacterized protein YbaR (Trm112 family)
MHIVLTDLLTCPHCGPEFGLILLAQNVEDRRALEGVLGCANCREKYAIRDGAVFAGGSPVAPPAPPAAAAERLAALLGVTQGPAFVLLAGPMAGAAAHVAALVEDLEVIAVGSGPGSAFTEADAAELPARQHGVNRLGVGARLPLAGGKVAAVALSGSAADGLLEEGARVLSPVGRLVVQDPPEDAVERLERAGLRVVARDPETLVAVRA